MPMAKKVGIVLSGTAPAMTLMSGAMLAFAEHDVEFEVISTTGVGGLIGMMYLAPKGGDRKKALNELKNLFVSDWLYKVVPFNFKVFHKFGSLAPHFYQLRKGLPRFNIPPEEPAELKRLFNDWMQLWATVVTPASYESLREAFMSHVPLVQDLVDFERLNNLSSKKLSETRFYLNAFSLASLRLHVFPHDQVTPDVYNGAQSMFMLLPPVATNHDLLTTGATRDPTGLQAIWSDGERTNLAAVLALDPLTTCFWRKPTDAYDAFQLMLMNPIVALQQVMYAVYAKTDAWVNGGTTEHPQAMTAPHLPVPRLFGIPVAIPKGDEPRMLKWTHANAVALQEAGYRAASTVAPLLNDYAKNHPDDTKHLHTALAPLRFIDSKRADGQPLFAARPQQFVKTWAFRSMFNDMSKLMGAWYPSTARDTQGAGSATATTPSTEPRSEGDRDSSR